MSKKSKANIVLPLVLIGAVMLSGIGFMGLILSSIDIGDEGTEDRQMTGPVSSELDEVEMQAESRFDESFHQAEGIRDHAPSEREIPISKGFQLPPSENIETGDGSTRSSDDLLDDSDYIEMQDMPDAPDVDLNEALGLLNGNGQYLGSFQTSLEEKEAPSELQVPGIDESVDLPVMEDGMDIDTGKVPDLSDEIGGVDSDISTYLGENTPDTTEAGITREDLEGMIWSISNKTTVDTDTDGNAELVTEVRVAEGSRKDILLNGTLQWVAGFEYTYVDDDSDGVPNKEELMVIRFANYTISGKMVAQGISFSSFLKNDTIGDGNIDIRETRHLSFGSRMTLLGTTRSYATAGELIESDVDGDGTFEDKEATAILYYKHETTNVTLRESVIMVHGSINGDHSELSRLAFNRNNSTAGKVLLEVGYIWSYKETSECKELVVIGARNNTFTGRVQYAIFNLTEKTTGNSTLRHLTAFAVDNRTLLLGGVRSEALAVDLEVNLTGNIRTEEGFIAGSRNDDRPNSDTESFLLISLKRDLVQTVLSYENITVLAGTNVTRGSSLNSTMGYLFREYKDMDMDGSPELLKVAAAFTISRDADSDGIKEWETYIVRMNEIWDNDSDGSNDLNHTFSMMGIKSDPDDDGNIDIERGLMVDVKEHDSNSNGFIELVEEGMVGFIKTDDNSDGLIDHESYKGFWKRITDEHDDGTVVNETSGTWTNESP